MGPENRLQNARSPITELPRYLQILSQRKVNKAFTVYSRSNIFLKTLVNI